MGLSTTIRLPKDVTPRFPDRCVYSGDPGPDSNGFVIVNSQGPLLAFLAPILLLFGWRRVRVPVSRRYLARFYFQNLGRDLIMVVIVFAAIFVFMPMLRKDDPLRKFKVIGLALVALIPWVIFEVFLPRRFDATARKDYIDYEFASEEYAEEFAMLNAADLV